MKKLILGCTAVAILVGCASPGAQYENEAVAYALETEAELRAWVNACERINGPSMAAARDADRLWWERNQVLMAAADYGFVRELDNLSDSRREESVALFAMRAGYGLNAQMNTRIAEALDTRNPQRECVRALANFEAGDRDLNQNQRHYSALVALSNEANLDGTAVSASRQPARPETRFGRSYYEVEASLARSQCTDPTISMLRSDWPRETYEAQCANQQYQLISCEWNRCTVY